MLNNIILAFIIIFLTSRFFSETLHVLPKAVDILDFPFIILISFMSLSHATNKYIDLKENRFITFSIFTAAIFIAISIVGSPYNVYGSFIPGAILFGLGFLEGPLLFFSLNKIIDNPELIARKIKKIFYFLVIGNLVIVVFLNIPMFIATGNPDLISGTYGNNAYQFSFLLIIISGFLLGDSYLNNRRLWQLIVGQGFIWVAFYLMQFRSAIPFFMASFGVMIISLYGRRFVNTVLIFCVIFLLGYSGIEFAKSRVGPVNLKYDDWTKILSAPSSHLRYGKFQAYPQTIKMLSDRPLALILGAGPGNFMSRAYDTFSYEIAGTKKKGVGKIAERIAGLNGPRFTLVSEKYLAPTRTGAVYGSYQLSNPNSSFLSPIAEIGLIGGGMIIAMYVYMIIRSLTLLRICRESVREYIPMATAFVAGSFYLFGLAFLDNYWEMSRCTLPVWILFWATSAGVNTKIKRTGRVRQLNS